MAALDTGQPAWTSWEVVSPDGEGQLTKRPVSSEMDRCGDQLETPINKMRLFEHHGWPDARSKGVLEISRSDTTAPKLWILKCKPSCWRLYLYVDPPQKRLVYLYAKCKKKWKQDAEDSRKARRVFQSVQAGRFGIIAFQFPSR